MRTPCTPITTICKRKFQSFSVVKDAIEPAIQDAYEYIVDFLLGSPPASQIPPSGSASVQKAAQDSARWGGAFTKTDHEKRIFNSGCDFDLVDLLEFVRLRTHACISHACQPVGLGPGEITHGVGFAYYTFLLDATSMPIIANDGIRLFPASARIPKITRSRGREVITTSG